MFLKGHPSSVHIKNTEKLSCDVIKGKVGTVVALAVVETDSPERLLKEIGKKQRFSLGPLLSGLLQGDAIDIWIGSYQSRTSLTGVHSSCQLDEINHHTVCV